MKKIFAAMAVVLILLMCPALSMAGANFTVDSMDVSINVNDNNSYDVTERIVQNYSVPSHGMYRTISTKPVIVTGDAKQAVLQNFEIFISNVNVDNEFDTNSENGIYSIRIGDPDKYVEGIHADTISYNYYVGEDKNFQYDQFYYNITGNDWETPISNVSFSIEMPHEFDASKLGFSVGSAGVSGYDPALLKYNVAGTRITGTYSGTLYPGEGITLRLELPEGYYTGVVTAADMANMALVIILAVFAVGIILFLIFRNRKKPVVTVEFYPPEGMTSADVGYIIDGDVEIRDVVSLLIYWAQKGYMEIHENEKKGDISFKHISALPDSANSYEKVMFNRLFEGGEEVTLKSLEKNFYSSIQVAQSRIKEKFTSDENTVFVKSSLTLKNVACAIAALPVAIMGTFVAQVYMREIFMNVVAFALIFVIAFALASSFCRIADRWQSEKKTSKAGSIVVWIILTAVFYLIIMLICSDVFENTFFIPPLLSLLLTFITPAFRRRTDKGLEWYGRILGLKNFIEKVELEKLKMLVNENPEYFYSVLPYAYVLGLSDKWAKQFESIAVEPPNWYYGSGWSTFSTIYFTSAIMSSMSRAQTSMLMSSSDSKGGFGSSGGGGFSGGGFSGGGFGGGGGGSW